MRVNTKLRQVLRISDWDGCWRFLFGGYLFLYGILLTPYVAELYATMLFPEEVQRLYGGLPAWLFAVSPAVVSWGLWPVYLLLCFLLTIGRGGRVVPLLLFIFSWWCFQRNPISRSPEYEYVLWLIFVLPFAFEHGRVKKTWCRVAWILLAAGYTHAGFMKILHGEQSWRDGTAVYYLLTDSSARFGWYGTLFDGIPKWIFVPATYTALALQICSLPCLLNRHTRFFWWLGMTFMHIFILPFADLWQLTLGMLFFHAFVWEAEWPDRYWLPLQRRFLRQQS